MRLLFTTLLLCVTPIFAAGDDAFAQQRQLGKGMNMGNALEAPNEGAWGARIHDEDFPRLKKAGFDSVRIPVKWSAHADRSAPYAIDAAFMARVEHVVRAALDAQLAVVLNVHHYDELDKDPVAHRERFTALWTQIATRFAGFPDRLQFEAYNEPHDQQTAKEWNLNFAAALKEIRKGNPTRAVHVGGVQWNQVNTLKDLDLPADDRHLILHIHYYSPFHFTHQGAPWMKEAAAWKGTKWDGTPADQAAVRKDFDIALAYAKAQNRPVHLGEFGSCSGVDDMAARVRWTNFIRQAAEERGFTWSYWEYQAHFGIWDPKAQVWRTPLVDALVK